MTRRDVLSAARAKIVLGWTRGESARDASGRPVDETAPRAVRWCAGGAITTVRDARRADRMRAYWLLVETCAQTTGDEEFAGLERFNDNIASKRAVLELYDRAIEAA